MKKIMMIFLVAFMFVLMIVIGVMVFNRILPIGMGMHKSVYQVDDIALEGYDATSYFKDGAKKGDPKFSTTFQNATWYFFSEENLEVFKEDPGKFVPNYGGYCAKAISTGLPLHRILKFIPFTTAHCSCFPHKR